MTVIVCSPLETACVACDSRRPHTPDGWLRAGSRTYCTPECLEEWEAHLADLERERSAAWCPTCGYDQHEHAPDCADHLTHLQEQRDRPELYR